MRKCSYSSASFLRLLLVPLVLAFLACEKKELEKDQPSSGDGGGDSSGVTRATKLEVSLAHNFSGSTTVIVSGVQSNDSVKIYKDSACSQQVGSAVASGSSVNVSVSGLAVGSYSFYANVTNSSGQSSGCSTAKVDFKHLSGCPSQYVPVVGDPDRGVDSFCVMKFEAKNVGGVPTSAPASAPWMAVSADAAKSACLSLSGSATGEYYDLMSNKEWMTLSDDILSVSSNWYATSDWNSNVVGAGVLSMGFSNAAAGASPAAVSDENDPISDVVSQSNDLGSNSRAYYRTFNLSSGDKIWDIAGNAFELVDYDIKRTYTSPPACSQAAGPSNLVTGSDRCPAIPTSEILPVDSAWGSPSLQGIGAMDTTLAGDGTLLRGGYISGTTRSGVNGWYGSPVKSTDAHGATVGFRCVKRFYIKKPTGLSLSRTKDVVGDLSVTVQGVESGHTVYLYKDRGCSELVSSQAASGTSATFSVTGLAVGTTYFSARQKNANDVYSGCYTGSSSFENVACPTGYLAVNIPTTSNRGSSPFCVMQFEAKQVAGKAASKAAGAPWTGLSADDAKSNCRALNTNPADVKYDLMSNREWMSIADEIARVTSNFDNGSNANGNIGNVNRGNYRASTSNGDPDPLAVSDVADEWSDVKDGFDQPTTDFAFRRTHRLTSDLFLWDFSGNATEIVDMGTGSTYTSPPACSSGIPLTHTATNVASTSSDCGSLNVLDYQPANMSITSSYQIGHLFPGIESGKILLRGGDNVEGTFADYGINSMVYTDIDPSASNSSKVGFRCVYRP